MELSYGEELLLSSCDPLLQDANLRKPKEIEICDDDDQEEEEDDKTETYNDHDSRLDQELNLIGSFNNMASNSSETTTTTPPQASADTAEPRVFSCNYCQRKFYSSQALGGHQNAHKRERNLAKRGQRMGFLSNSPMFSAAAAFGHTYVYQQQQNDQNYCSSLSSLPLHGFNNNMNNNRSLGIQVHSMIHKPPNNNSMFLTSSSSGFKGFYGPKGWSSRPHVDQQPTIGKLPLAANYTSNLAAATPPSHVGVGRFDGVRTGSMNSNVDKDESSGNCLWWPELKTNNQDESQQQLDLSLKL